MAKLKPSQIRGTVSDWKIVVKQNDDLFREAVPSDFPNSGSIIESPVVISFVNNTQVTEWGMLNIFYNSDSGTVSIEISPDNITWTLVAYSAGEETTSWTVWGTMTAYIPKNYYAKHTATNFATVWRAKFTPMFN